jgi:serine/threonine protein kinase
MNPLCSINLGPGISSKADVKLFEVWSTETDKFKCSRFTHFDSTDHVWIGQKDDVRKYELTVQDLNSALTVVPDEKAFPRAPEHVTPAATTDPITCFVKRPQVHALLNEDYAPYVPQMLMDEVEALEFLKDHPHPNIVLYHGCKIERGYLTGIVLQRQPKVLDHRFLDDATAFNVCAFESQLQAAVEHVHGFGFAHNDLNPSNIALNERDEPIIIDWGSSKKFGEQLLSAGTPEWIDEEFDVSKKEHDISALHKIVAWVKEKKERQTQE